MSITDLLLQQISGQALNGLSKQLGMSDSQAGSAIAAALPMIVGALAKNASNNDGAASLANALTKDHDGGILDNLTDFLGSTDNGAGPGILKHVLGGNRGLVEAALGQMAGINQNQAGGLLENLAPLVMGALGKQQRASGLDAGGIADLLMGESTQHKQRASGAMDMLGKILDADGDGSMLDDVGGLLGGLLGGKR